MSSEHTISIATASRGETRGEGPVSMPVDELMASNGLVTGQSGADPATSARRLAQSLVDAGETLFVVDPSSEFGGLADHSSVLHVGGDRDCDVQVEPGAVDRVASLALEGSTSIVLDLAAFDASGADDLLGSLTDELVDARRGRRSDLLLVVDECHRWLAQSGPATRTGKNLVQLGGRRHDGVGIVGVTDQPADVREDVRSGVDWVLAHRLTWQEDLRALEGMLDRHHVEALETLDDDEAVFNAGWERTIQRIHVGLGEADRASTAADSGQAIDDEDGLFAGFPEAREPESVDSATVRRGSTNTGPDNDGPEDANDGMGTQADVDELRDQLADVENRLASLEAKLDARADVEDMADRIADAITEGLEDARLDRTNPATRGTTNEDAAAGSIAGTEEPETSRNDGAAASNDGESAGDDADEGSGGFGDVFDVFDDDSNTTTADANSGRANDTGSTVANGADQTASTNGGTATDSGRTPSGNDADDGGMSFEPMDFGFDDGSQDVDSTVPDDFGPPSRHGSSGRTIPRYLRKIVRSIEEMDVTTRRMLAFYIEEGTESPMDAHFSAGGGGDRTRAYAHNRQLRTNGLIEHVGKGQYAPRLREYVVDEAGHSVPEHELDRAVDVIRQTVEAA